MYMYLFSLSDVSIRVAILFERLIKMNCQVILPLWSSIVLEYLFIKPVYLLSFFSSVYQQQSINESSTKQDLLVVYDQVSQLMIQMLREMVIQEEIVYLLKGDIQNVKEQVKQQVDHQDKQLMTRQEIQHISFDIRHIYNDKIFEYGQKDFLVVYDQVTHLMAQLLSELLNCQDIVYLLKGDIQNIKEQVSKQVDYQEYQVITRQEIQTISYLLCQLYRDKIFKQPDLPYIVSGSPIGWPTSSPLKQSSSMPSQQPTG